MAVNTSVEQLNLMLTTGRQEEVADSVILRCKDLDEAIALCITTSGLSIKEVAYHIGYAEHPEQLSKMLSGGANFPSKKLNLLMDACGNEIPLRWQNLKRGYGIHPLKSALELENESLRAQLDQERREREVILKAFKEVNR